MSLEDDKIRLLASALYETRILLSEYLGSEHGGDQRVREAAHLSSALHNDAFAVLEGEDFDYDPTKSHIEAISGIISGSDLPARVLNRLQIRLTKALKNSSVLQKNEETNFDHAHVLGGGCPLP